MTMFRNLKLLLWKNFILKVGMVICRENVSLLQEELNGLVKLVSNHGVKKKIKNL